MASLSKTGSMTMECGYCLSRDTSLVDPKMLPCSHVHCKRCLSDFYRDEGIVRCPICSKVFDVKIAELTSANAVEDNTMFCDMCTKKGVKTQPAVMFCITCSESKKYCAKHKEWHDMGMEEHTKISIDDYIAQQRKYDVEPCKKHKDRQYDLGCKICLSIFCGLCVPGMGLCNEVEGAPHELISLDELIDMLANEIGELKSEVLVKEEKLLALSKATSKIITDYEGETEELVENIHKVRDEQIRTIKEKYDNLEKKLVTLRKQVVETMTRFLVEDVNAEHSRMNRHRLKLDRMFRDNHKVDIVNGFKDTEKQIKELVTQVMPILEVTNMAMVEKEDENRNIELKVVSGSKGIIDVEHEQIIYKSGDAVGVDGLSDADYMTRLAQLGFDLTTDWKSMIYTAARDGNVGQLKKYLGSKKGHEAKDLVNFQEKTESEMPGATPLVIASLNGHYRVVQFLIEHCEADVEFSGSVTIDGKGTIEGAPPLWCAAVAGHLNIVKFLIDHSANVNNTTLENSTPLRAACFDGLFDIVKYLIEHGADIEIANIHGNTCLMITCYNSHPEIVNYLLEKNASINEKDHFGSTALHNAAESGNLKIIDLLVEHNAKIDTDVFGSTPLMLAAANSQENMAEYLMNHKEVSEIQRIGALELLGTALVDVNSDTRGAVKFWKRAFDLKNAIPTELENANPTDLIVKPASLEAIIYGGALKVQNVKELNKLTDDQIRMQALLVRKRILGPTHPFTINHIYNRGLEYRRMGDIERCISFWLYALDMIMGNLDYFCSTVQMQLLAFIELYGEMLKSSSASIKFSDICSVFSNAIAVLGWSQTDKQKKLNQRKCFMTIVLHLMFLICHLPKKMTTRDKLDFKRLAAEVIKMQPSSFDGQTLLHLTVRSDTTTALGQVTSGGMFPCLECVELLLELKAPLELLDQNNNSALHIACMQEKPNNLVITALIEAEARTDWENSKGKRPMEYLH